MATSSSSLAPTTFNDDDDCGHDEDYPHNSKWLLSVREGVVDRNREVGCWHESPLLSNPINYMEEEEALMLMRLSIIFNYCDYSS